MIASTLGASFFFTINIGDFDMKITIGNLKEFTDLNFFSSGRLASKGIGRLRKDGIAFIYCGRPSILGNPFPITSVYTRDMVVDKYKEYLDTEFKQHKRSDLAREIIAISDMINRGKFPDEVPMKEVVLLCYCYPQNCHATVIKDKIIELTA